jgi:hypothetical protein
MSETALVLAAALIGGFLDASVGGGGLVLVPALFAAFPSAPHAELLGTNKFAASTGLSQAVVRYARQLDIPWQLAKPLAIGAFSAGLLGACVARWVPSSTFRLLVPIMLSVMLIYIIAHRQFGLTHHLRDYTATDRRIAWIIGIVMGFYDGFFGPGAGAVLMVLFVRYFACDLLYAGALARITNFAACSAALLVFALHGEVRWLLALALAASSTIGAWAGSRVALRQGAGWLRKMFIGITVLLIIKTAWDALRTST